MQQLCSEKECFRKVDTEEIVQMLNGKPHPVSQKCWDCRTKQEHKSLKNYKKRLRQKANKKLHK